MKDALEKCWIINVQKKKDIKRHGQIDRYPSSSYLETFKVAPVT